MSKFEKLEVWKLSHELVLEVYKLTNTFPEKERYRLTDQLCRAASSVPANICEGTGRSTDKEFVYYLHIARGSLYETKYHLILAKDLNYIETQDFEIVSEKCESIGRQLNALINSLGGKKC